MSIKDLFEEKINSSPAANKSLDEVGQETESADYIKRYVEERERFVPHVDFSRPENFARFGLAEKYYDDSIKRIYEQYPYDGSLKEKIEWHISSSYLDNFIFENEYPRTNGYATFSPSGWGTAITAIGAYGATATASYEYVKIKGGPNKDPDNTALSKIFPSDGGHANIFDTSNNRESNLQADFQNNGVTVEFWLKQDSFNVADTKKQVVFDLWNGHASSSADYGRLTIEISGTTASESPFYVTAQSGTTGFFNQQIGSSIAGTGSLNSWKHYAFSFLSASSGVESRFYVNGDLNQATTLGTSGLQEISGDLIANIGSLRSSPSGSTFHGSSMEGWGKLSGSIDEFRFWKTKRTSKDVGRFWFTQVGGGTNTDTANTNLGVYYKFNEGITTNSTTDAVVLDYSGRISNGAWTGYTSAGRSTGSAMVLSNAAATEFKDPIIYSLHPDVVNYVADKRLVGKEHDFTNNSSIFNSYPSWIQEDDGDDGELRKLTQVISSYLDTLYSQIEALPTLKNVNYLSSSASASFKPYPFSNKLLISMGLNAPNLFENSEIIEQFLDRDEDRNYEIKLADVKNNIYNNIYNNLVYIYKSKGTEKAFRNMIRCFGVDDELIKINLYADNETYVYEDRYREASFRNTYADFNNPSRFTSTVHQYKDPGNSNTTSFLSASVALGLESGSAITVEAEILLPEKFLNSSVYFFDTPFSKSCLFGMHTADTALSENNLAFAASDVSNFQVYAVRNDVNSPNAKFLLTGSTGGYVPEISSSIFLDAYNNERWNLAVRIKPSKYPFVGDVAGTEGQPYEINFYGVNATFGTIQNEFEVTGTVTHAQGMEILANPKRIFAGAHYTNFTGSLLDKTDVKVGSVRVWYDYLSNEALQAHAVDPSNYGTHRTYKRPYLFEDNLTTTNISEIETMALHWTFDTLTGSDAAGQFIVPDFSSGSSTDSRHGWISNIVNRQHSGRGYNFPADSTGSLDKEYNFAYRQQLPEVLYSADTVNVLERDDEVFTREKRPIKHYIAIEKSMYQEISNDMLKMFATITDFNNLVGEPVNRYRQEYKDLGKLRQLFYEKVNNTPDFEKFVEFYKWFDGATNEILQQLMPASAATSGEIRTMIESHILERNKYWNKFPTLEAKVSDPESGLSGINELLYDWRRGHAPVNAAESQNCLWWNEKAEREGVISSGDSNVDSDRNMLLTASLQVLNRRFTTPHRFLVGQSQKFRSGANSHQNKRYSVFKTEALPIGAGSSLTASFRDYFTDCSDELAPNKKTRISLDVGGLSVLDGEAKGETTLPFSVYSSSANPNFAVSTDKEITNLHNDLFETALQGVFPKQHVGGHQHRNIGTIENLRDTSNNNVLSRAEAFRVKINGSNVIVHGADRDESGNVNLHLPRAMFFRDETAQRPLSLRNIKSSTSKGILGNYQNTREFVQTSNRMTNNSWFSYSGSSEDATSPSILFDNNSFIIGAGSLSELLDTEYTKPVRGRNGHVVVERFSAPGGPETAGDSNGGAGLDALSAEYSLYNTMNYRNSIVRQRLNDIHAEHVGQFGIDKDSSVSAGDYNTIAAFHKINRNTLRRIELSGALNTPVTASVRDNMFIQHPIPQSDLRYSWISSSAVDAPLGLAIDPRRFPSDADTITFLSGSQNNAGAILVDFVGLNTYIYDPIVADENILSSSDSVYRNTSIATITAVEAHNALNLNRNGPYGYSTFKQIRTGEHPIARDQRKNNRLQYIKAGTSGQLIDNGFQQQRVLIPDFQRRKTFIEPAVTSKFKPLRHILDMSSGEDESKTYTLKHTYGNNISYFANEALNNNFKWHAISENRGLPGTNSRQIYNDITDLYLNNDSDGPVRSFKSLRYRETIYPRPINAFLERTRSKINYDVGTILKWRNSRSNRQQTGTTNTQASSLPPYTSSMWPIDGRDSFDSGVNGTSILVLSSSFHNDSNAILSGGFDGSGELMSNYAQFHNGTVSNVNPVPLYARRQLDYQRFNNMLTSVVAGDIEWTAGQQAGQGPFYDTYSDFSEDIKRIGKDYSIIPEFTISDHMDYYLDDQAGNFLDADLPNNIFSLLGAEASSSADPSSVEGSQFFKLYNSTDFLKHFEIVDNDHPDIEGGYNKGLTLSCQAIKKFRPRYGFYPAQRTLQLAELFSASYAGDIELTGPSGSYRTMLAPFFAPGIMYNTIKSGIAVDYPIYTGSYEVRHTNPSSSALGGQDVIVKPYFEKCGTYQKTITILGTPTVITLDDSQYRHLENSGSFPVLDSNFHYRVPFEAIISPHDYAQQVTIVDNEPHPSASLNSTASLGSAGKKNYTLAASNFFAETAEFFLKQKPIGKFTNFVGTKTGPFNDIDVNKSYKMDVLLTSKLGISVENDITGALFSATAQRNESSIMMYGKAMSTAKDQERNNDLAFGPPVVAASVPPLFGFLDGFDYFSGAPFTPPYYDGPAKVTLEFNPRSALAEYSNVKQIIREVTASYSRSGLVQGSGIGAAFQSAMQISSSVNLFGTIKGRLVTTNLDPSGDPSSEVVVGVTDTDASNKFAWTIESKFETPILDFTDATATTPVSGSCAAPKGMWHQYGSIPNASNKGIFLQIDDSQYQDGSNASLADLCGFSKNNRTKRLGEVTESKKVEEAIVAIPILRGTNTNIDNIQFIVPSSEDVTVEMNDFYRSMYEKYVMPPKFFKSPMLENIRSVQPSFYIFEFEHDFSRSDLVNIWQNLSPDQTEIAKNNVDQSTGRSYGDIIRVLNDIGSTLKDVQWIVFKVKKRASYDYFEKTLDTKDDDNFKTSIGQLADNLVYSYNWPYDYFSLVELIKIDAEVEYTEDEGV